MRKLPKPNKPDELSIISRLNKIAVPMQDYEKIVKDVISLLRKTLKYDKLKLLLLSEDKPEEIVDEPVKLNKLNKPNRPNKLFSITIRCEIRGKTKAIITLYSNEQTNKRTNCFWRPAKKLYYPYLSSGRSGH